MHTQPMNLHITHAIHVRTTSLAEGWSRLEAALERSEAEVYAPACLLSVAITRLGAPVGCDVAVVVRGSCRRIMHVAAGDPVQLHVPPGMSVRLICVRHDTLLHVVDLEAVTKEAHHAIELEPRSGAVHQAIAMFAGQRR